MNVTEFEKERKRIERQARIEAERRQMLLLCKANHLPAPEFEFRFYDLRKWRLDYAWPASKVAIEQDGGLFVQGGHNRGRQILLDHSKRNTALFMGWAVYVFSPSQIRAGVWIEWVRGTMKARA